MYAGRLSSTIHNTGYPVSSEVPAHQSFHASQGSSMGFLTGRWYLFSTCVVSLYHLLLLLLLLLSPPAAAAAV